MRQALTVDASVLIISFNTCDLLARCRRTLMSELEGIRAPVFVVEVYWVPGAFSMLRRGESSKKGTSQQCSETLAHAARELLRLWCFARVLKNRLRSAPSVYEANGSARTMRLLNEAWRETAAGMVSPERPW